MWNFFLFGYKVYLTLDFRYLTDSQVFVWPRLQMDLIEIVLYKMFANKKENNKYKNIQFCRINSIQQNSLVFPRFLQAQFVILS